jgi:hypothetical protein
MVGSVTLQARAADGNNLKFNLVANTGVPMTLPDFPYPVVVDIKGAIFDKAITPIIMDHDPTKRIGHTLSQRIDAASCVIEAMGVKSSGSDEAAKFEQDLASDYPFQVSIGAKVIKAVFVPKGKTVSVNGRTHDGPLIVSRQTLIRELSVCVLGADSGTSVSIAATASFLNISAIEEVPMDFEAFVKSMGLDITTMPEAQQAQIRATWDAMQKKPAPPPLKKKTKPIEDDPLKDHRVLLAKEESRVDSIRAVAGKYSGDLEIEYKGKKVPLSKFKQHAIKAGVDAQEFELACLRSNRPKHKGKRQVHVIPGVETLGNDVISCAVLKASGNIPGRTRLTDPFNPYIEREEYGIETWYDEKVLTASDHRMLKGVSLWQVMDMAIHQHKGVPYTGRRGSEDHLHAAKKAVQAVKSGEIRAAGFTTLDITNIFEDVANKQMWAGYNSIATVWEELVHVISVNDFKTYNFYRLDNGGAYQKVGNDGELKHGKFTEEKYSVSAETYGKMVGMTRKNMINDDLGAFNRIMTGLGQESARTIEEVVLQYLMAQTATIFPTNGNNENYIANYPLSAGTSSLAAAEAMFMNQVNAELVPIGINPDRILVGSNNLTYARNLYVQATLVPTGDTNARIFPNNEYVGRYRPIVTPYINNTAIKQRVDDTAVGSAISAQTQTGWFMLCPPNLPQGGLLLFALLNGRRRPYLEQAEAAFDVLGMLWRAYHDFGIATGDYRLGLYSKGAT